MKAKVLVIISFFVTIQFSFGQKPHGDFSGALTRDGSVQLINLKFSDSTINYSIPELGLYNVLSEKTFWRQDTLNIKFYYGNFYCFYDKKTNEIIGVSEKWDPKIRLHVKKSEPIENNFTEENIQFSSDEIIIKGSIYKPKTQNGATPYVVLIHGSDYQDRKTPYYRSLAYSLANSGIGVLFYDKRGCGQSTGNLDNATFTELADDAIGALSFLKSRTDLNISKIGFLGTSQGGWISVIAANKTQNCSFVVLNVGPSVSLFEQDLHRVEYSMKDDGWESPMIDSAVTYSRLYFKYVQKDNINDWKALEKYANSIKNNEWAEYVNIPSGQKDEDILWWRKNAFDPSEYLKKMNCPVLSILGEKDVLVPPAENKEKMDSLLKLSGQDYKIVVMEGCAHDMLTYQGLNGANWDWPTVYWQWRKQPTEFMQTIIEWIKK